MTRGLFVAVCALGCANLAGLEHLEVNRDDSGTTDLQDTKSSDTADAPPCEAASRPLPTCEAGMEPVPGGCFVPRRASELVIVEPFCVDTTEVTFAAYLACVKAGACATPEKTVTRDPLVTDMQFGWSNANCTINLPGNSDRPINCIDAPSAEAQCASRGARLPTDAEWEWIAHGGSADSVFPWGNETPGDRVCWGGGSPCTVMESSQDVSPFRLVGLAGNVAEWTSTTRGTLRFVRGGSYNARLPSQLTGKIELDPSIRSNEVGFRCAK